ncbi:hypothetical protein DICVIV_02148 [Dictyocaulus viviparus]|uniref:Ribosome production factor 2 homolog n=1 Tax=Dictyocaulus viviparus TaxID=29172 RepID=A0A0D8Y6B9_DICVI|nr:hypothetical protein DICVIV_02148 [Dictyocaulus viviparus]
MASCCNEDLLLQINKARFEFLVVMLKSAGNVPRIELLEMGPSIDFKVDRTKIASDSLFKAACKKPKSLTAKRRKNMSEDVFGSQLARVHIGKQNIDAIQTRKVKALRKFSSATKIDPKGDVSSGWKKDGGNHYNGEAME